MFSLAVVSLFLFSASGKIDDQIFINKNISAPGVLRFHPYEPYLAVSDRGGVRYVCDVLLILFTILSDLKIGGQVQHC